MHLTADSHVATGYTTRVLPSEYDSGSPHADLLTDRQRSTFND